MSPYRKALEDMLREWDRMDRQPRESSDTARINHKVALLNETLDKLRAARKAAKGNT